MGNQIGYGSKSLGAMALVTSTAIATLMTGLVAGTITASAASSYVQVAQYVYEYGPNNKVYRIDENARRNNEMFGSENRRIRQIRHQIRRQIRRENRAKRRARARAARQRLYDVREQERRGTYDGYVQRYDGYGNPVPRRITRPYPRYNQPRKTRQRVKLVYVPIPREKPYHLIAQAPVKKTPAEKIIKTATAPKTLPKQAETKATQVAALPKIEIETLPNPSSSAPIKIKAPTTPAIAPATAPTVKIKPTAAKPIAAKPIIKEASTPAANQISCKKARNIIIDYGFSDVKKITCKGKDYDFNAKRDGKPFKITLSALSGELKKVLRQK